MAEALAVLELPRGGRLPLTAADALMAARMVEYEGAGGDRTHAAAILWTVAQRADYLGSDSYAELVRAFSQPLNPLWSEGGAKCRPGSQYWPEPSSGIWHCSPERLDRREQAATAGWDDLSAFSRSVVSDWVRGRLPNPVPGAVDFASGGVGLRNPRLIPLYKAAGTSQVFFAGKLSSGADTVGWRASIEPPLAERFFAVVWPVVTLRWSAAA